MSTRGRQLPYHGCYLSLNKWNHGTDAMGSRGSFLSPGLSHHVDGTNVNEKTEDYEHPGDRQPCFLKEQSSEICLQVNFEIKISSFQEYVPHAMELASQPARRASKIPNKASIIFFFAMSLFGDI